MINYKILLLPLILEFSICQYQFSGFVNFSSANRIDDGSLIQLPYRIAGTTFNYNSDEFSINGDFAMEYYIRNGLDFMNDRSIQEFALDLRELYFQFYTKNTEFRFGKQIHSWGMVDENSPLDVVSPYDYYYLFNSGTERKLGSWSLSTESYLSDFIIKMVISPFHQTNRLPIINGEPDPEFGFELPVSPKVNQFIDFENKLEYGMSIQRSVMNSEISLVTFSGYDKLFNLTGINAFGMGADISFPKIDIVYGYRHTKLIGLGFTNFINGFTIRSDIGFFSTKDNNSDIRKGKTFVNQAYDSLHFSYPLEEKAEYYQLNIQFEYELTSKTSLLMQFFNYDILNYSSGELPIDEEIDIPNLEIDPSRLSPEKLFIPGLGSPFAALSKQSLVMNINRYFLDNQLLLNFGSLLDFNQDKRISGTMNSIGLEYDIAENIQIKGNLTNISGSENHPDGENYRFNQMEKFSNIRLQIEFKL